MEIAHTMLFIHQKNSKHFAGGGSTLIAAKRLNRRYIGFEIDKQYYDMAVKRLETEPQQMSMFLE